MVKRVLVLTVAAVLIGAGCQAVERIVIAGTGDSQGLLRNLARAYEKSHPGIAIEVPDSIGSSGGIRAAAAGACDLGRVARPLREREKRFSLGYRVFALSPVVLVAHPGVKGVDGLTSEQVVGIYAGQIDSWRQLGGADQKIYVAHREAGDSSRSALEKNIPGFGAIREPAGKTIYSTPETIETIARYPFTIGYGPLAMVAGTGLRVMKLDGVSPSPENVGSGKYPLVTPLGLVWKGRLEGPAKAFVDFLFSPEGQRVIARYGAIPVSQVGE